MVKKRRWTWALGLVLLVGAALVYAASWFGGDSRQFEDDVPADESAATESEPGEAEPGTATDATAAPATPEPTAAQAEPTPTVAPQEPPAEPDDYFLRGTAEIVLDDGRTYVAEVGCDYAGSEDLWTYRFGGETAEGVQVEGAYDASQPDFVILFLEGNDPAQGGEVLLTNVNGGDDLQETSNGGPEWLATVALESPEGAAVSARLSSTCG